MLSFATSKKDVGSSSSPVTGSSDSTVPNQDHLRIDGCDLAANKASSRDKKPSKKRKCHTHYGNDFEKIARIQDGVAITTYECTICLKQFPLEQVSSLCIILNTIEKIL